MNDGYQGMASLSLYPCRSDLHSLLGLGKTAIKICQKAEGGVALPHYETSSEQERVSRPSIHFHSEMQRRSCETWLKTVMDRTLRSSFFSIVAAAIIKE